MIFTILGLIEYFLIKFSSLTTVTGDYIPEEIYLPEVIEQDFIPAQDRPLLTIDQVRGRLDRGLKGFEYSTLDNRYLEYFQKNIPKYSTFLSSKDEENFSYFLNDTKSLDCIDEFLVKLNGNHIQNTNLMTELEILEEFQNPSVGNPRGNITEKNLLYFSKPGGRCFFSDDFYIKEFSYMKYYILYFKKSLCDVLNYKNNIIVYTKIDFFNKEKIKVINYLREIIQEIDSRIKIQQSLFNFEVLPIDLNQSNLDRAYKVNKNLSSERLPEVLLRCKKFYLHTTLQSFYEASALKFDILEYLKKGGNKNVLPFYSKLDYLAKEYFRNIQLNLKISDKIFIEKITENNEFDEVIYGGSNLTMKNLLSFKHLFKFYPLLVAYQRLVEVELLNSVTTHLELHKQFYTLSKCFIRDSFITKLEPYGSYKIKISKNNYITLYEYCYSYRLHNSHKKQLQLEAAAKLYNYAFDYSNFITDYKISSSLYKKIDMGNDLILNYNREEEDLTHLHILYYTYTQLSNLPGFHLYNYINETTILSFIEILLK